MSKKIALIVGTRPEAIKLAPLYLKLVEQASDLTPLLWVTAQHRELLDQVMEAFQITPDLDFNLMRQGQSLSGVTCDILERLRETFAHTRPDLIVVQGDTTTVFASALAAFYEKIPVAHVEAGLRTWNRFSPYPEEVNRQLTSSLADLHFAPTEASAKNLLGINIPEDRVFVTGNTVIDALDIAVHDVRKNRPELPADFPLASLEDGRRMVLITGHRRESFGGGFQSLCEAIRELSTRYPAVEFIYPMHMNPNVREPVNRILSGQKNIHLIEPLPYKPFVWAMDRSYFLLSDSGGVQEEAPHLGKPVLVMRDTTERPEAIDAGTSILVGTDQEVIVREATRLLDDEAAYKAMSGASNPFGDGHACERIIEAIRNFLA